MAETIGYSCAVDRASYRFEHVLTAYNRGDHAAAHDRAHRLLAAASTICLIFGKWGSTDADDNSYSAVFEDMISAAAKRTGNDADYLRELIISCCD